jgi:hypothetical protein
LQRLRRRWSRQRRRRWRATAGRDTAERATAQRPQRLCGVCARGCPALLM